MASVSTATTGIDSRIDPNNTTPGIDPRSVAKVDHTGKASTINGSNVKKIDTKSCNPWLTLVLVIVGIALVVLATLTICHTFDLDGVLGITEIPNVVSLVGRFTLVANILLGVVGLVVYMWGMSRWGKSRDQQLNENPPIPRTPPTPLRPLPAPTQTPPAPPINVVATPTISPTVVATETTIPLPTAVNVPLTPASRTIEGPAFTPLLTVSIDESVNEQSLIPAAPDSPPVFLAARMAIQPGSKKLLESPDDYVLKNAISWLVLPNRQVVKSTTPVPRLTIEAAGKIIREARSEYIPEVDSNEQDSEKTYKAAEKVLIDVIKQLDIVIKENEAELKRLNDLKNPLLAKNRAMELEMLITEQQVQLEAFSVYRKMAADKLQNLILTFIDSKKAEFSKFNQEELEFIGQYLEDREELFRNDFLLPFAKMIDEVYKITSSRSNFLSATTQIKGLFVPQTITSPNPEHEYFENLEKAMKEADDAPAYKKEEAYKKIVHDLQTKIEASEIIMGKLKANDSSSENTIEIQELNRLMAKFVENRKKVNDKLATFGKESLLSFLNDTYKDADFSEANETDLEQEAGFVVEWKMKLREYGGDDDLSKKIETKLNELEAKIDERMTYLESIEPIVEHIDQYARDDDSLPDLAEQVERNQLLNKLFVKN